MPLQRRSVDSRRSARARVRVGIAVAAIRSGGRFGQIQAENVHVVDEHSELLLVLALVHDRLHAEPRFVQEHRDRASSVMLARVTLILQ